MSISEFIYTRLLKPKPLRKVANWVIKLLLPESVMVNGARIFINPNDPVVSGALTMGVYEKDEISFFKKTFNEDMIFVDVGANVGLYTGLALSTPNFSGTVLCIEPHAESQLYLTKTIACNRPSNNTHYIFTSQHAASNIEQETLLYTNTDNKGDNRLYSDPLLQANELINTSRIDKLCLNNQITEINFLKIDVQGAEFNAIKGAESILNQSPNCIILSEFWPFGLQSNGHNAEEYLQLLKSLGFNLYLLGKRGTLSTINEKQLIQSTQGRNYRNIVGLKGAYQY